MLSASAFASPRIFFLSSKMACACTTVCGSTMRSWPIRSIDLPASTMLSVSDIGTRRASLILASSSIDDPARLPDAVRLRSNFRIRDARCAAPARCYSMFSSFTSEFRLRYLRSFSIFSIYAHKQRVISALSFCRRAPLESAAPCPPAPSAKCPRRRPPPAERCSRICSRSRRWWSSAAFPRRPSCWFTCAI